MMFTHLISALLAPVVGYAAAFPSLLPEPTLFVPAIDIWSPEPTKAPQLPTFKHFRREQTDGDNTCGFVSGLSESSITCYNTNEICATNTYFGVHGCCNPSSLSACKIPTTCIPAIAMSTACTDSACSTDAATVKCTESAMPECYKWLFVYSETTMTQHGCAESAYTSTAQRSWGPLTSSTSLDAKTVTVTASPVTTSTSSPSHSSESKTPSIGAIVGATVGGCVFLSLIAFLVFLIYRKRTAQREAALQTPRPATYHNPYMTEHNSPHEVPATGAFAETEHKVWQQQGGVHRVSNAVPQYPGMNQVGIVEVDGVQRPVEAPT